MEGPRAPVADSEPTDTPPGLSEASRPLEPLALDLLRGLGAGLALLSVDRRILASSEVARRALLAGDGLLAASARLSCQCSVADSALESAIRIARLHPGTVQCLSVPRPSRARSYGLSVIAPEEGPQGATHVVVMVTDPDAVATWTTEALQQMYGLTHAEARVVRTMLEEHSVDRARERLGLSRNTVKTHLRRVFRKNGVSSWAALVAVLVSSPVRAMLARTDRDFSSRGEN